MAVSTREGLVMELLWGVVITVVAAVCWGGQTLALIAPGVAERLTLTEKEDAVAPAFYADVRGEAAWDALTLWTLVAAGLLLIADSAAWPYFGLVGGAMYVYFAGRGVLTRRALARRGLAIGDEANVRAAFVALPIWGMAGLVTIIAAAVELAG